MRAVRWANSYGYQTRFERADGALHQIDEGIYQVRHHAWAWIKGFHLQN